MLHNGDQKSSVNVQHAPLVEAAKVFPSPLYIKLGLDKNFVKPMDHQREGIKHNIGKLFSYKTEAKI